jgi:hypothetical protein
VASRRLRQYAGLALVVLAFLGGILGWTWALQTVETDDESPVDTTAVEGRRADLPAARAVPAASVAFDSPSFSRSRSSR